MATGDKLIQVKDLKKYYNRGAIKALDGVTVDIDKGHWSSCVFSFPDSRLLPRRV